MVTSEDSDDDGYSTIEDEETKEENKLKITSMMATSKIVRGQRLKMKTLEVIKSTTNIR